MELLFVESQHDLEFTEDAMKEKVERGGTRDEREKGKEKRKKESLGLVTALLSLEGAPSMRIRKSPREAE